MKRKHYLEPEDVRGYLTVKEVFRDDKNRLMVRCECKCGNTVVTQLRSVATGHTSSCGCYPREINSKRWTTHGKSGTPEYSSWENMRQRCLNPNFKQYADYGGRGITICDRLAKFENFLEDMKEKPGPEYTLERKDVNGPYSPENCEWLTRAEQNRNTTRSIWIEYEGKRQLLLEWAKELGIHHNTLSYRYHKGLRPPLLFQKGRLSWGSTK